MPPRSRSPACVDPPEKTSWVTRAAALPAIEHVVDEAIAALCSEAVGTMQAMHETTLEYLKTRQQFGRPIGQFQVLQHRSVDMLVALEQARSMAMFAAVMAGEEKATERRRAIAAAKVQIGRSGRHIGQEAIQLHGGIGMTMEYKVGHYFKRMTMIDKLFGDADVHLETLARLAGCSAIPRPPDQPASRCIVAARSSGSRSRSARSHIPPALPAAYAGAAVLSNTRTMSAWRANHSNSACERSRRLNTRSDGTSCPPWAWRCRTRATFSAG